MWIIPSNHPLYSRYAAECVESKEDLSALLEKSELPLMWKSKPSSTGTWLARWNKVYWLPQLFGRTLKPSLQKHFATSYTALLAAIPASPSATRVSKKEPLTLDTFGRTLLKSSSQQSLFGASLKMCLATLKTDSQKCTTALKQWATQLREDCTQRLKLARHTSANGSSFSQLKQSGWATPNTMDHLPQRSPESMEKMLTTGQRKGRSKPSNLREQIHWRTPAAQNSGIKAKNLKGELGQRMYHKETGRLAQIGLIQQVELSAKNWGTPRASDAKQTAKKAPKTNKSA